ncbi:preprotein translocase subunit YajC [Allokutzneria sp. A3M-2-11 16]|uniref:preprotein translocase subunit YajC n=1 Tax=Allokutzneria sp. A3M-2-11 16 TaxID=2962043 RepID=UPI0020B69643|nr:preprotein translocase subunit YajC [Allokutzneria sp. A3M-2-11 16]MCP3801345.1 preprotein translocase subunit YajC [Allokutzneria sp. A3M-2-11 16]
MLVVLALPLFLSARKQKKVYAEMQQLQSSLGPGDRVMTSSGLYATVLDATDDTTIELELAPGVHTTWLRQAIREKVQDQVEDSADALDDEDADTAESKADLAPPLEEQKNK